MINSTLKDIVFAVSGEDLDSHVREALRDTAIELIRLCGIAETDLPSVTTKTHSTALFSKVVLEHLLCDGGRRLGVEYINQAYFVHCSKNEYPTRNQYQYLMLGDNSGSYKFGAVHIQRIKRGIGMFLIALHSRGVITLPSTFNYPIVMRRPSRLLSRTDVAINLCSELLGFIRLLDPDSDEIPHPAFSAVGGDRRRREWFLSYATKTLLATGWHNPSDASIDDLLRIKNAQGPEHVDFNSHGAVHGTLIDVLRERFGSSFAITSEEWSQAIRENRIYTHVEKKSGLLTLDESGAVLNRSDDDVFLEVIKLVPSTASGKALRKRGSLPGLTKSFNSYYEIWIELQDAYLRTEKRESYKTIIQAFGYLNIYLFFYLPYWFHRNSETNFQYPDKPNKLIGSIFVSRIMRITVDAPRTFMEMMDGIHKSRKWVNNGYYSLLKKIEGFFFFWRIIKMNFPVVRDFVSRYQITLFL